MDRSTLVPRIKNFQFAAALRDMKLPADQMPFTQPLVADLLVTYAFDLPDTFQMASGSAIAQLGLRSDALLNLAMENMRRVMPEIEVVNHDSFQRLVTDENLVACMLLEEDLWRAFAKSMNGELVAAVPSRDVVLFCGSESTEGVSDLRNVSRGLYHEAGVHALTHQLLVWRADRWEVFTPND